MPSDAAIHDTSVFGKFPNFDKYIDHVSVTKVLERLSTLDREYVEDVVNSIPVEWRIGQNASIALIDLICRRANFVVQTIAARLVDDPPIPGI